MGVDEDDDHGDVMVQVIVQVFLFAGERPKILVAFLEITVARLDLHGNGFPRDELMHGDVQIGINAKVVFFVVGSDNPS